jgi:hypothetical protein
VLVEVVVIVPVMVVSDWTLKTNGLRTVKVKNEVMNEVEGTKAVIVLVATNVVVVITNSVHEDVVITILVVVTQHAHWSHGHFKQVNNASRVFKGPGAKHFGHPGGQQGSGADGHG